MKYRIFIESDILHKMELQKAQREVSEYLDSIGEKYVKKVFDHALDFAWHDLNKTWKYVKKADEIYADSSLMPLLGNSYMGAPVIFNGMCERAIKEDVRGKSVFVLRTIKDIYWHMIDIKVMKKAFKHNKLFMYDDMHDLVGIDVNKVKKK